MARTGKPRLFHRQQKAVADFIRVWQKASSAKEVASHFGLTVGYARLKANRIRIHGVPLKQMSESFFGARIDWKAMRRLALILKPKRNPFTEHAVTYPGGKHKCRRK